MSIMKRLWYYRIIVASFFAPKPFQSLSNDMNATTSSLVPYLSVTDAEKAIEFYSKAFNVEPTSRLTMPDGRVMHCEFQAGDARFYVSEELPEHGGTPSPATLKATTVAMHLYVADCDATTTSMTDNGAELLMAPADMFWGERFARVRDPFGHEWGIATVLQKFTAEEIQIAANKMFAGNSNDTA